MIGRKFTGHLLLFLCCYCLTSAAKETITCDAPSVRDGQPATVTCDFKRDVSALSSATVTVEHYPNGSADPTPVLECTPVGADCKLPVPGYEFNKQINTKLVLKITSASMENSGRFACKMLSPDLAETDEVEPCDFTVVVVAGSTITGTTPTTTTTTDNGPPPEIPITLIAVVISVMIAVLIAIGIFIAIIRKKSWLCFSKNRTCQTKERKPGNQKNNSNPGTKSVEYQIRDEDDTATLDVKLLDKKKDHSLSREDGGGDGGAAGEATVTVEEPVEQENAIEDDESGDESKTLLSPVDGSVDSPHRQQEEKDDTIPEDTVRTPETVTEKVGPSEDAETEQEEGVVKTKGPGVEEVIKKLEEKKDQRTNEHFLPQ